MTIQLRKIESGTEDNAATSVALANTCVRYGFCSSVCPTYVLLGDERDSPRGRIALIKEMFERGGAPDPSTVVHLDRCLACYACMRTCAAGVNYRLLLDQARHHIETHFRRPLFIAAYRWLLRNVMSRPRMFALGVAVARRVPESIGQMIPGAKRLLLLARQAIPEAESPTVDVPAAPEAPRRGRVVLLDGCVQRVLAPRINAAAARVLQRCGYEVVRLPMIECCGALALHMGHMEAARKSAARCIKALQPHLDQGLDAVVIAASGCGSVIRKYDELFRGTEFAPLAARISAITRDPSEILMTIPDLCAVRDTGFEVAVHEPCSLRHGLQLPELPQNLLQRLGFFPHDVPESHMCCGSAGTYSMLEPEISDKLGRRRADQIRSVNAQVTASANIGCLHHLGRFLAQQPVHVVELVDWATGGPMPPELNGLIPSRNKRDRSEEQSNLPEAVW